MATYKGKDLNTTPTDGMVEEATRALDWRESERGGTAVGVARARDIKNRKQLSISTVKRMRSFFARHEVDKQAEALFQAKTVTRQTGALLGRYGAATGQRWANNLVKQMETLDAERHVAAVTETDEEIVISFKKAMDEAPVTDDERFNPIDVHHHYTDLKGDDYDEDDQTVQPVERSTEKSDEIARRRRNRSRVSRLRSAPLLLDHDPGSKSELSKVRKSGPTACCGRTCALEKAHLPTRSFRRRRWYPRQHIGRISHRQNVQR